jgi:hypothetical protein
MPETTETVVAPKRNRRTVALAVVAVGLMAGSFAVGAATAATPAAVAEPEVKTVTETEYQTEWVDVTPAACKDALKSADAMKVDAAAFAYTMARFSTVARQSVLAAFDHDVTGMNQATDKIVAINGSISRTTTSMRQHRVAYDRAAQECRAS